MAAPSLFMIVLIGGGLVLALLGVIAAIGFTIWANRRQLATGRRPPVLWINLALVVGLPLVVFLALGAPLSFDYPVPGSFNMRGGMVVGPEFGPIAGFCVAAVNRRKDLAKRSLLPLVVGFPAGITAAWLFTLFVRAVDLTPEGFTASEHPNTYFIAHPDAFSFIVAIFAGIVGMLSLTNAKSGALVGVLISVATIPAAANIGVAAAFGDGEEWTGAMDQLSVNLVAICKK